jgi:hypothetical protein
LTTSVVIRSQRHQGLARSVCAHDIASGATAVITALTSRCQLAKPLRSWAWPSGLCTADIGRGGLRLPGAQLAYIGVMNASRSYSVLGVRGKPDERQQELIEKALRSHRKAQARGKFAPRRLVEKWSREVGIEPHNHEGDADATTRAGDDDAQRPRRE